MRTLSALIATALATPAPAYSLFDPVPADKLRPLCVERPGAATPPCIVDAGHVQVEVGLFDAVFATAGGRNASEYAFADTSVRIGLGPTTEAMAGWTPLQVAHLDGRSFSGIGDIAFGLKQSLANPDGSGFSVAVKLVVVAPTAAYHPGNHDWIVAASLPVSLEAGDFALSFTPEATLLPNALQGGSHFAYSAVVGIGRAVGPVTAGIELWTAIDDDPAARLTATTFNLTAAWTPQHDPGWAFDAGAELPVGGNVAASRVYFGVSRRF